MIQLLKEKATLQDIQNMLERYENMIKIVIDVRRRIVSGGGEMPADCESVLLEDGSEQDHLWGANWYPAEQRVEFESLINIRPRLALQRRFTLLRRFESYYDVSGKRDTVSRYTSW